jgi:hypothetical protein
MSLAAFQSVLAKLVTSSAFRDDLRARGDAALAGFELTPRERARAARLASDCGVKVTATLVDSFRLGKILGLVPLTRTLLGDVRLAEEARGFWAENPPRSFYAIDEVVDFCDYLQRRLETALYVPYLSDVLSLERTMLDIRRPRPGGGSVTRPVSFQHDPVELLGPLAAGQVPHNVRVRPCVLLATAEEDGSVHWAPSHATDGTSG